MSHQRLIKYFTEFEFCFNNEPQTVYWFPVIINANNLDTAEEIKNKIISLLTRNFTLLKTYELRKYKTPLYSKTLKPLVENKQHAVVLKLNLKNLEIASFGDEIGIQLAKQYTIVPQVLLMQYSHRINMKLADMSFLTTQFYTDLDYEKEFLVLKYQAIAG